MRRIVHISDVHFGKINQEQVGPITKVIHELKPHLTVISGDLTQRARAWQFAAARTFYNQDGWIMIIKVMLGLLGLFVALEVYRLILFLITFWAL